MVAVADSRLRAASKNTLVLTIPKSLVLDSQFPFKAEDEVLIFINKKRLIIEKSNGG